MKKFLLKNKKTSLILVLLVSSFASMQSIAQKKVVFICNSAFNPAGTNYSASSSLPEADPFIKLLQADPTHFTVTIKLTTDGADLITAAGSTAAFYANYDLVVTQESFSSGSAIWKPAGLLGIKNITIPVIYTKAYAFRSTNSTTNLALTDWSTNTTDALLNIPAKSVRGSKLAITVPPANQSNPLFTGIDFSGGNDVKIFNKLATDAGLADASTSIKAVDINYNENITNIASGDLANQKITLLASITPDPTAAAPNTGETPPAVVNENSIMCVNDIPGGTYFGTAGDMLPATSRMIFFAYNYGATALGYSDGVTSNVTAEGLKIFKNAALILTGQSLGVKENNLAANSVSVSPNPTKGVITVNGADSVESITVFDNTGKKVAVSKTNSADLSKQASGIYFAKIKSEKGTTTKKIIKE